MKSETTNNYNGIGLGGLLGVAFIILKIMGIINWAWIWVLAPIWIPIAIAFIIIILYVIFATLFG